ncbi:MAG: glycosyltransferase [Flavobacteriaceae bacterium]|nr:MAG: glycosyltransferase [Flavobacteriaceae bacterium]
MAKRFYSIIIPVYNRPDEVDELLESLTHQTYKNFEVIIVEDGSVEKCDKVVEKYVHELNISYCYKENAGQGFARNYGYERAKGEYFIVFDSDCLIPYTYLETVESSLNHIYLDAYGGPDKAHHSFSPIQKAINFSMTSILTTGGIRNKKKAIGGFSPKSFNMGISRIVYDATGGYIIPYKGEDIEFSTRIRKMGFKTGLIKDAFVYHKRRTSWFKFFKQLHFFGTARINIARFFPDQLKLVHFFPAFFTLGFILTILMWFFYPSFAKIFTITYAAYFFILFIAALISTRNLLVSILSIWAGFLQLTAYGTGLLQELLISLFKK